MNRYFLVLDGQPTDEEEKFFVNIVDNIWLHDSTWERRENAPINQFKPENDFGPNVFVTDFSGLMRYIAEASCIEDIDLDAAHYLLNIMMVEADDV